MDDPVTGWRDDDCVAGTWRNGLWMVWTRRVTLDGLRSVDRIGRELVKTHPRYVTVSVSINNIPMPDTEAREYAAKLVKQRAANVLASATVLLGDGFWMSASRLVTSAIFALSGQRNINTVCATFDEAAKVIEPHIDPKPTKAEVVAVLESIRRTATAGT